MLIIKILDAITNNPNEKKKKKNKAKFSKINLREKG